MSHNGLTPYIRDIDRLPLIDAARERELGRRVQAGDREAWRELVQANLRLALWVAKGWKHSGTVPPDRDDLIQAANIGLMRAARKFDPGRGVRFGTYAVHWIRLEIRRSIRSTATPIHIPHYLWDVLARFHRAKRSNGDDPMAALDAMGLPPARRAKLLAALTALGEFRVADRGEFGVNPWEPCGPAPEPRGIGDYDPVDVPPFLSILDDRERRVLAARFGLDGRPARTLKDVGTEVGLTRERVRRVVDGAIEKLRGSMGVVP